MLNPLVKRLLELQGIDEKLITAYTGMLNALLAQAGTDAGDHVEAVNEAAAAIHRVYRDSDVMTALVNQAHLEKYTEDELEELIALYEAHPILSKVGDDAKTIAVTSAAFTPILEASGIMQTFVDQIEPGFDD